MRPATLLGALAWLAITGSAAAQPQPGPQPNPGVIEDTTPLQVDIGGHPYALESLIVRKPGTERLPIARITHGNVNGDPRSAGVDWLRGWAHDLANRGWLAVAVMRRGYGKSDGDMFNDAGTCAAPDVGRYLDADGHALFFAEGGRQWLLPELDRFLRAHGLPTWDESRFAPLLARLSPADRAGVENYLTAQPSEKALALGPHGGAYWYQGKATLEAARQEALAYCRKQTGADCQLAAENDDPVPTAAAASP